MANIFESLRKIIQKKYPVLLYYGLEVAERLDETWGYAEYPENFTYSRILRNIISIVKAKTLRYIFEKDHKTDFTLKDIVLQLCPNDIELADHITKIIEKAIEIDNQVQRSLRLSWNGKVFISNEDLSSLVTGPLVTGSEYDSFVNSAVTFKDENVAIDFLDIILDSFDRIFSIYEGSKHIELSKKDYEMLNKMYILKSNAIDLLTFPDRNGYMLCVDSNKRFSDGERISTESAWTFSQKEGADFSIIVIN